jgi:hypothetical protein
MAIASVPGSEAFLVHAGEGWQLAAQAVKDVAAGAAGAATGYVRDNFGQAKQRFDIMRAAISDLHTPFTHLDLSHAQGVSDSAAQLADATANGLAHGHALFNTAQGAVLAQQAKVGDLGGYLWRTTALCGLRDGVKPTLSLEGVKQFAGIAWDAVKHDGQQLADAYGITAMAQTAKGGLDKMGNMLAAIIPAKGDNLQAIAVGHTHTHQL